MEKATFAGGCFWCTEAIFKMIKGVSNVDSGYTGGLTQNPTYEQVSSGSSGHAEAIQITFDPKEISYKDLLYIFLKMHDPTQLNRQGADVGTQYRSVIYYHGQNQKLIAEKYFDEIKKEYTRPVVTGLEPLKEFFKAEEYHQDYYENNPDKTYCRLVIDPKIDKLKKDFSGYLNKTEV